MRKLLSTGVHIYEIRPCTAERKKIITDDLQVALDNTPVFGLHAKSKVVDGNITVIGTFNLDLRSANLNTECVAIIHSEDIAIKVLKGMEIKFSSENSWKITSEFNPDSEVGNMKRLKTWTRKLLLKEIL